MAGFSTGPRNFDSSCFPDCKATQAVNRIIIFGRPGSGKSAFAKSLSKELDSPLYHLDRYYFAANWAVRNKAEFLAWQQRIVDRDRWIIDGNNLDSLGVRYARADAAIYFNRSKLLCYWRVCRRRLSAKQDSSDRPADCPERIAWILLTYMWDYARIINKHLPALQEKYPHVQLYEIKRGVDLEAVSKRVVEPDKCVYAEQRYGDVSFDGNVLAQPKPSSNNFREHDSTLGGL